MEQFIGKHPRIEAVDALRGFAVMAILLVHNLEHFIFPVYPADSPGWLNALDQGVFNVVFTLFAGKAYAIFALLFGFTFYIQSDNLKRRGGDFGYRFLLRLVRLAVLLVQRLLLLQRKKQTIQNRQAEVIPDQTIIRPLLTVEVTVSRQLYPIT